MFSRTLRVALIAPWLLAVALSMGCITPEAYKASEYNRNMGYAALQDGDQPQAVSRMREATKKNRWDAENWHGLALAYFASGDLQQAEEAFDKALSIKDDFSQARLNLASLMLDEERWAEAVPLLEQVVADPEYREPSRAQHNLAWAKFNLGQYDEARALYRKVLRQFPRFCPSLHNLGQVDEAQGRLDDALARYRQAAECDSSDLNIRLSLGSLAARMDHVSEACEQLGTVHSADPYGPLGEESERFLNMLDCASIAAP